MKEVLVTGAAGFIGSHLSEYLVKNGYRVTGIDSFSDYYERSLKEDNLARLKQEESFDFIEADILEFKFEKRFKEIKYLFHLAAQPGVRGSWGENFRIYTENNIQATQRLLEEYRKTSIEKFIFASSSSVYGDTPDLPMKEQSLVKPYSPYGVTKLAAENLCYTYFKNYQVPVVSLRYFTVFGPRQRPDMAFNRFIKAALKDEPLTIYGDGNQTRDFTFVADIVKGTYIATKAGSGEIYNIGGGHQSSIRQVLTLLEESIGKKLKIEYEEKQRGDVRHTLADTNKIRRLGYDPRTSLPEGLKAEIDWMKERL